MRSLVLQPGVPRSAAGRRNGGNPWVQCGDGAGEGNRTLVFSLGSCCSTIELHPQTNGNPLPRLSNWGARQLSRRSRLRGGTRQDNGTARDASNAARIDRTNRMWMEVRGITNRFRADREAGRNRAEIAIVWRTYARVLLDEQADRIAPGRSLFSMRERQNVFVRWRVSNDRHRRCHDGGQPLHQRCATRQQTAFRSRYTAGR